MSNAPPGTPVTPLATLNRLPGWLGTLVLSPDGSILQSAGELVNNEVAAHRFAAVANRIGRLINLEKNKQSSEFKRLTVHFHRSVYIMTCVGDTIYVVKRANDEPEESAETGVETDAVPSQKSESPESPI
ncbi:unnamed protein product [Calicophoron daubneyi]|uniref:Late endosomal/lysosomal adaptor and MAPK and MTOR activator 4 n=1 Tax=Calicophoron daubneyi TaxID=300641 RepID=A0AAV2SYN5_CALDB